VKLIILYEPTHPTSQYSVHEIAEDGGRIRHVGFTTEQEAREYCEGRQKARVIAEYELG